MKVQNMLPLDTWILMGETASLTSLLKHFIILTQFVQAVEGSMENKNEGKFIGNFRRMILHDKGISILWYY